MITEDYVSFETSKRLKGKGFEGDINAYYHIWDNGNRVCSVQEFSHSEAPHLYIPAPTLQMAIKWLETTYYIFICIDRHFDIKDKISHIACGFTYSYDIKHINSIHKETGFSTYEEACEAAIKYCLENLI